MTTTIITNVNTITTTTTTIPAPANTAALAVYKTTTMREQLDCVADACCVIATPTSIPAQLEAETTNASTDSSPSDIGATYTAVRQHGVVLQSCLEWNYDLSCIFSLVFFSSHFAYVYRRINMIEWRNQNKGNMNTEVFTCVGRSGRTYRVSRLEPKQWNEEAI
jgi:hypothetical protein